MQETACSEGDSGSIPGLEKFPGLGMATHSSVLAWEIPWIKEPGVPRVGHDLATKQQTTLYN